MSRVAHHRQHALSPPPFTACFIHLRMNFSRASVLEYFQQAYIITRRRPVYLYSLLGGLLCILIVRSLYPHNGFHHAFGRKDAVYQSWNFTRDRRQLVLNGPRCQRTFPGLFEEVDRIVGIQRANRITPETLDQIPRRNGYLRVMLYDQQVLLLSLHTLHD